MTQAEQDKYRERLLGLGKRLRGDMTGVQSEALRQVGGGANGNLSNAPLHTADLGTDAFDQDVSLSLMENEQQILDQVAAALDRLDQGTYGTCQECGRAIGPERLQALPYTSFCVACARREQEEDGHDVTPNGNL